MIGSLAGVTLLLFIVFLPGLAFRRNYYTGPFSKQYTKPRFDSLLIAAFVPALLLQLLGYYQADFFGTEWFYEALSSRLFSEDKVKPFDPGEESLWSVPIQQLQLIGIGVCTAGFARTVVRATGLDRRFKLLRFQNTWQYILRGEIYEFPEVPNRPADIQGGIADFVYLDVLVEGGDGMLIYRGTLFDYQLNVHNGIEQLILYKVSRRRLSNDPDVKGDLPYEAPDQRRRRFYKVPGDMLVLYGDKIVNLNVRYPRLTLDNSGNRVDDLRAEFGTTSG